MRNWSDQIKSDQIKNQIKSNQIELDHSNVKKVETILGNPKQNASKTKASQFKLN